MMLKAALRESWEIASLKNETLNVYQHALHFGELGRQCSAAVLSGSKDQKLFAFAPFYAFLCFQQVQACCMAKNTVFKTLTLKRYLSLESALTLGQTLVASCFIVAASIHQMQVAIQYHSRQVCTRACIATGLVCEAK